ncbi:hypothetical protein [Corynebacterium lowii]|uniref:Uncharacterized protein n=1 Tax=Corynebacterium lowii TaxID=1544413 RepID=A0A0Q0U8H3_9CORY|nr:hypothetical protein [Corynebacterium lowii]KQB83950.1 hypothetical protein Clow_02150 [Corynebacterium lowii]MDP9852801.1 amino acid permease [Corynebacterium lowii]
MKKESLDFLARVSIAISLLVVVGTLLAMLFTDWGVDRFLVVTLPAGLVALVVALVGKSAKGAAAAIGAAICPLLIFWLSFFVYQMLYLISFGHIVPG